MSIRKVARKFADAYGGGEEGREVRTVVFFIWENEEPAVYGGQDPSLGTGERW